MILYINTAGKPEIEIAFKAGGKFIANVKIAAERAQAEKLLPEIAMLLKKKKVKLEEIESIEVGNSGGSFTSLRIGVATANALGFALGVPVKGTVGEAKKVGGISIVAPAYDREPEIG